ncbi:MAG: flagellar biosynthetic protein FliO [Burkholderiaceae bacterium]|nr:flagellar biosynthetic protein FliO [Burkholderiaceae bacterium]MBP6816154.1 flagellar biosynthetic protein FliO [Burkholderiaceae bacterium]
MTASLVPSLLAFIAVIAMIPVALWLMKRAQVLRPGAAGPLSIVAGLSMGPRDRIAVIHAGGRYLVVGITAQQMTLLAQLEQWPGSPSSGAALAAVAGIAPDASSAPAGSPDAPSAAPATPLSPFSRLLRRLDPNDPNRPHG